MYEELAIRIIKRFNSGRPLISEIAKMIEDFMALSDTKKIVSDLSDGGLSGFNNLLRQTTPEYLAALIIDKSVDRFFLERNKAPMEQQERVSEKISLLWEIMEMLKAGENITGSEE